MLWRKIELDKENKLYVVGGRHAILYRVVQEMKDDWKFFATPYTEMLNLVPWVSFDHLLDQQDTVKVIFWNLWG